MFYSSPRNGLEVQVALLEKLDCDVLMLPAQIPDSARKVLESHVNRKYILPDLDFFLSDKPIQPYPYNKTWEEARNDPYVVLPSSGTTGIPKLLFLKQGTISAHDAFQRFSDFGEKPWYGHYWTGKRVITSFPWVHAGGVFLLSCAIYNSFTPVIANEWPLSGATADHLHVNGNVQAAWYSPSVLQEVARNPTYLENIADKLDHVSFAGGILPAHVGNPISARTLLFGTYVSTETGILPGEMPPAPKDWEYYRYNKRLGHSFQHFADNMYELVLRRDKAIEMFQGVFYTFPNTDYYSMRDLYIPHPTREGWWRSAGRVDDIVIFSDATKLNPIPYEAVIEEHPAVATALICGTGRTRPAVLVQPRQWTQNDKEEKQVLEEIGSSLKRANEAGPVDGRLIKELVVLTKAYKPMARSGGKDTVQRKTSVELYEKEIEHAYQRAANLGLL